MNTPLLNNKGPLMPLNEVRIYEHLGGYGVQCLGYVSEKLALDNVDVFDIVEDAHAFALQARNDTNCTIVWDIPRPSWAVANNEDLN